MKIRISVKELFALFFPLLFALNVNAQTALDFDGSNDYVVIPDNSALDFTSTYTIEAYIYVEAYQYGTIISKFEDDSDNRGYMINMGETGDNSKLCVINSTLNWSTHIQWNTGFTPSLNTWYHIAITYDQTLGSNNLKLYVDGSLYAQTNYSTVLPNNAANLYIGGYDNPGNGVNGGANGRFFNGRIDEVRLWNDVRTPSEISTNYNIALGGSEAGLVAYYKFNDGTANVSNSGITTADDATSNNLNGTITNFALSGTSSNFVSGVSLVTPIPVPTITSFSPSSGIVGSSITITGTNFNSTTSNNIVFFGATKATVTAASTTSLTVTVPSGATFDKIYVLNTVSETATLSSDFFTPIYNGTSSFSASDFDTPINYTVGNNPVGVAIGDMDGDGKSDILVTSQSGGIYILRNTSSSGSLSFASASSFSTGGNCYHVAVGDIDGDGKLDIATANYGSNNITVLRNTSSAGSLSFASAVSMSLSTALGVVVADIDGDGRMDVTGVSNGGSIKVFLNTSTTSGTITFDSGTSASTASNPYGIACGDIDGDNLIDIVVQHHSSSVGIFRNTSSVGSVSFATRSDYSATGTNAPSLGDIDGDGKLDVVVSQSSAGVLRNTSSVGSISFASVSTFSIGSGYSPSIADINGDGNVDIATGAMSVIKNTSSVGSLSFASSVSLGSNTGPYGTAFGDLDGDGKPDFVAASQSNDYVRVVRNNISSNNADLSAFSTSAGALSPTFASGTTSYTAPDATTATTTITATRDDANATLQVRVNGGSYSSLTSGVASSALSLNLGANTIDVLVTAQDGTTTKTYTITLNRISVITSIANGNWSSTSTWDSGTVPTASDNVIVNHTVTANQHAYCADLEVNGTLSTVWSGSYYSIITCDNATLNTGGTINFAYGVLAINNGGTCTNSGGTWVNNTQFGSIRFLGNGTFSGSSTNVYIYEIHGTVDLGSATYTQLRLLSPSAVLASAVPSGGLQVLQYDVSGSITIGNEWPTGTSNQPKTVIIQSGSTVNFGTISTSRNIGNTSAGHGLWLHGTLNLSSVAGGDLNLRGATTQINGTLNANGRTISIISNHGIEGTNFVVDNLTLNTTGGTQATLSCNATITNLTITAGYFNLGNYSLTVNNLTGGSSSNFIYMTGGNGVFTYNNIPSTATTLPVGHSQGYYTPITITNGSGNVSVKVTTSTASGTGVNNTAKVVGRTWEITAPSAPTNATIALSYPSGLNGNGASFSNTAVQKILRWNTGTSSWDNLGNVTPTGTNPYTVTFTNTGTTWTKYAFENYVPNTNADLSTLTLTNGGLNTTFASGTTSYTAYVANGISSFTVTPTLSDANASMQVRVNGGSYAAVANSAASGSLALNVGSNTVDILVTAEDGTTTKTYTLTVVRTPTPAANALDFDGSNDYVNCGTGVNLANSSFTVEMWAKHDNNGNAIHLFSLGTGTNNQGLHARWENSSTIRYGFFNNDLDGTATADANWHHYAFTYNVATNARAIYYDGVRIASGTAAADFSGTGTFKIGEMVDGYSGLWNGSMDEFRVWNDERTYDEIISNMYTSLNGDESNLVAYYNFDQGTASGSNSSHTTLYDLTTNRNHGTLTNFALTGSTSNYIASDARLTDDTTALNYIGAGNALTFNGSTSYVDCFDNDFFASDYTVEAWALINGFGGYPAIIGKNVSGGGNSTAEVMLYAQPNGNINFFIGNGSAEFVASGNNNSGDADITAGTWNHFAAVVEGTNIKLFINGVLSGTATFSGTRQNSIANVQIGRYNNGSNLIWPGKIDEVRIWSDARTAAEIRANMFTRLNGDEANLEAYYTFDNTSGTTLHDKTTNGRNGTLTNMAGTEWTSSASREAAKAFTTGGNWNSASTWLKSSLPNSSSQSVFIPTDITLDENISAKDAYVASGATLTISNLKNLNTSGNMLNDGVVEISHTGGLVQGTSSGLGNGGTFNVNKTATSTFLAYNFFGSPVTAASIDSLGGNRYYYNAAAAVGASNEGSGWASATGTMTPGLGYIATGSGPITFSGTVNNGTITPSTQINSGTIASAKVSNLIANPYPSGISLQSFFAGNTNLSATAYFWIDDQSTNTNGAYTTADFATVTGGIGVSANGVTPTDTLPSCQGFMVVDAVGGVETSYNYSFTNAMRIGNSSQFFRPAEKYDAAWIDLISGDSLFKTQMAVAFKEEATDDYDNGHDGEKMVGNGFEIYTLIGAQPYVIQSFSALSENRIVPFTINVLDGGEVHISLNKIKQLEHYDIYLTDVLADNSVNLSKVKNYSALVPAGISEGRFYLSFVERQQDNTSGINEIGALNYNYTPTQIIFTEKPENLSYTVIDLSGKILEQNKLNGSVIDMSQYATGVYIIQLSHNNSTTNFKFPKH